MLLCKNKQMNSLPLPRNLGNMFGVPDTEQEEESYESIS